MNKSIADELTEFAERLADESRAILRSVAGERPKVDFKADSSVVTETDRAIEARLRERIEQTYPGHGILGEEHGSRDLDAEFVWVLDPIDGTNAFIVGLPIYGTLISVARGGLPWIGVIDLPVTSDRWVGVSGEYARHNGKPVQTRRCANLASAYLTNWNPDVLNESEYKAFDCVRRAVRQYQYGGSCFVYGALVNGWTDLMVDGGLDNFDLFAPAAVISGAGGVMTDWTGRDIDLNCPKTVIAAGDPDCHAEALALLSART